MFVIQLYFLIIIEYYSFFNFYYQKSKIVSHLKLYFKKLNQFFDLQLHALKNTDSNLMETQFNLFQY